MILRWWHPLLPYLLISISAAWRFPHSFGRCPSPCRCGLTRVLCQRTRVMVLTTLPRQLPNNSTVTSLIVTDMNIKHVTRSDFSHLLLLEQLNLTHNRIETLADAAFQNLTSLKTLLIGDNFIRELTDETFVGLDNLKVVDLSRNRLVELDAPSFVHLQNLEVLDLAANEIEHIADNAFEGLHLLRSLILSKNKLLELREEQFRPLYSLEKLMLDDCSIQVIQIFAFQHLGHLKHLSLANNRNVGHLLAENFVRDPRTVMGHLDVLSLRGTSIKEVPVTALKTFPQLKNMDLSETLIPVIRSSSFAALDHLVNLTLEALPRLFRLEERAFFGLNSLESLTLANNRLLSNVSDGIFRNLSNLRYLDLSHNNLEMFPKGLADWQNLYVLDLRGNPLRCDCGAAWMLTSLYTQPNNTLSNNVRQTPAESMCNEPAPEYMARFTSETLRQRVACGSPARFRGRCLLSLTAHDLCSSQTASMGLQTGILVATGCCLCVLLCCLLVRVRGRLRGLCGGGYRQMTHPDSRRSSLLDVLELDTTQSDHARDL